ncbi:MAG: recombinase family protein [Gordonibacter sp.]|uniref:recombinase family protein n=1 Tax=Gordonibacter sp. TaxID=1968902 RepID=UPI002FCA9DEA
MDKAEKRLCDLLARAQNDGQHGKGQPWRTAVYISATYWYGSGHSVPELMAEQSKMCKAKLHRMPTLKKEMTFRERNTGAKGDVELKRLIDEVASRHVDCILVASVGYFGYSCVWAQNFLRTIVGCCGVRFIDCAAGFDSFYDSLELYVDQITKHHRSHARYAACEQRERRRTPQQSEVPYGYIWRPGGKVEVDEYAAIVVRRIFAWAAAGGHSGDIADFLVSRGVMYAPDHCRQLYGRAAKSKLNWSKRTIDELIENPFYRGLMAPSTFRVGGVPGKHECAVIPASERNYVRGPQKALVDEETYQKALATRNAHRTNGGRRGLDAFIEEVVHGTQI